METIKTDESQNVKKTAGYYRERIKSLTQDKKAYDLSLDDFLKRYTGEFQIKDKYDQKNLWECSNYYAEKAYFWRIGKRRLNLDVLKNGVEYMISKSEPITTLELSDAIGVDSRLQRFFLREFVDDQILSPKRAKVITKTDIEIMDERFGYKFPKSISKKEGFPFWKISDMEKAEKYVAFLEELEL